MNYGKLLQTIEGIHHEAKSHAAGAVNRQLILRNWLIGGYLVEYEQKGKDRANYGAGLLKRVATDLRQKSIPGCSTQMLERMRLLFHNYPQLRSVISSAPMRILANAFQPKDLQKSPSLMRISDKNNISAPNLLPAQMILRFSWTHLIELISIEDPWKREFFENECLKGNWSVRQLQRQIGSLLYERTRLSTDKQAVIKSGRNQAAESPQAILDLIRDPYVLEFAGLAEKAAYLERDLETLLLDHLQAFLLELGTGFCFEARQKRVTVGNEHDYIDLVFYHRILRCHLLIDLKVRPFQHGDAGQMNFYLNYWKDQMMQQGDQPPVGLILCADKNQTRVDYATSGLDHQLFVSRYLNSLPSPETLQNLIERDTATWLQIQEAAATYNSYKYSIN